MKSILGTLIKNTWNCGKFLLERHACDIPVCQKQKQQKQLFLLYISIYIKSTLTAEAYYRGRHISHFLKVNTLCSRRLYSPKI